MKKACQVEKNEHYRHILLFSFNKGCKTVKAAQDICTVYGDGAITERTPQKWFSRFRGGNFNLSDMEHTGRPVLFDEEHLNKLLWEDPQQTTRELAEQMDCYHSTVLEHLHSMSKVQKLGAWVPHVLNQKTKNQRCTITAGLLAGHRLTHGHKLRFFIA